jgi:hypothetical protein
MRRFEPKRPTDDESARSLFILIIRRVSARYRLVPFSSTDCFRARFFGFNHCDIGRITLGSVKSINSAGRNRRVRFMITACRADFG